MRGEPSPRLFRPAMQKQELLRKNYPDPVAMSENG